MPLKPLPTIASLSLLLIGATAPAAFETAAQKPVGKPTYEVVSISDVKWGALNPLRGDKGPRAANLWGDRTRQGATGFLVKFVDGFRSPPHIHNVSYRGVVIRGLVHNDDPKADELWMSPGSYWTQPKGDVHITAAKGRDNLIYVEIPDGPYLVRPVGKAFRSGEKPINVDASNIVWIDKSGGASSSDSPKIAYLWGSLRDGRLNGTLVKLPSGFSGRLRGSGPSLRAVIIQGRTDHRGQDKTQSTSLAPGSYFGSTGNAAHRISCTATRGCILYIRAVGPFEIVPD